MRNRLKPAPGPRRFSPFGSLAELRASPLETLVQARETYGDVVRFRIGVWSAYLLSHPTDIKHVLQDNHQNYRKGFTFEYLKSLVGLGLLTAEGDEWLSQRRLVQPAFHHERLDRIVEDIAVAAEALVASWAGRIGTGSLDIVREMTGFSLEVVSNSFLGADFGSRTSPISEAVRVVQEHINWRLTHLYTTPERYPTPRNLQFRRALHVLEDAVFSLIETKRGKRNIKGARGTNEANGGQARAGDILDLLLDAQDEDLNAGVTDLLLRDEVMTIVIAGHETTANALAWTWHFLASHPEAEERLHGEVDSVLNGSRVTLADIPRLKFTRSVFEESLRLRPPVWLLGRFPLKDDTAGPFRIPAQTSVLLSPYVTHRHPDFWENPERFDPDRFLPDKVAERPRHAYFPFGAGPRMCIGSEFAVMEAIVTLATIASQFRLEALPGQSIDPEPLITLRPKGGMPMNVHHRRKDPVR